jgi:hypothetical protein
MLKHHPQKNYYYYYYYYYYYEIIHNNYCHYVILRIRRLRNYATLSSS